MANANRAQQLEVTTEDKPGMLAEVTNVIAQQNVNLEAICAYAMEGKAIFYVITQDNAKAKKALLAKGWQVKEDEVVVVDLENKPGTLQGVAEKLKSRGINLLYCYGSTCESKCPCRFILKAEDNQKAIEALK